VGAVLRPSHLTSAELGVFGWIERLGKFILIPIAVNPNVQLFADGARHVLVQLRSSVRLDRLVWREVADDGAVSDWQPVVDRPIETGEIIGFELPAGPTGVLHLDFRAKRLNSDDWLSLDLNVWRPAT